MQKIKLFKFYRGDINGFFGLFLNNLTNLIVLVGLLTSIGIPSEIILGRIIPGCSIAIFVSSLLYFVFSYQLAKKENRDDVTCLPTGLSVPHMFLIVYIVMLPVYHKTNNPISAWHAAIAWTFFEGIVEISGAFIGPYIRKILPRASLLGSLAGVSLIFIALRPMYVSIEFPIIAFVSFAFILIAWIGKNDIFKNIPIGLIVIIVGIIMGIISKYIDFNYVSQSLKLSLYMPKLLEADFFVNILDYWQYIATALPLGIYNFLETMDNLESASAAGDNYDTRTIMLSDGITSVLGCLFGAGFPTALYIGHPGWKKMGGRRLYGLMSGASVLIVGCLGIMLPLSAIIPEPAILPILVFIGLSIAEQAVTEIPKKHAIAVFIAIFPWIAEWASSLVNSTINAALLANQISNSNTDLIIQNLLNSGISYKGLSLLGSGSILISIIWSSLVVFIIDKNFKNAILTTIIASILSYFGIIHSGKLGLLVAKEQMIGYLLMGIIILIIFLINKNKIIKEN